MNYNNINDEPVKESKSSKFGFIIHVVIGIFILISYVFAMSADWFNAFYMFEKIETIKRIYIVGIIAYIVISIMSQNGSEFNTKKFWIVIKNGIKLMLWWGLIIGALFILTIYHIFFPSSSLGLRDELEINEIKIPTLYKYTKHDDVFFSVSLQNIPEEDKMDFIIVSYKDKIPLEKINMYKDALEALGYSAELIEGTETYFYEVPDKSSYICIIINGAQISYGVVTDKEYQIILDGTWMMEENIF